MTSQLGKLYIVATPIGNLDDITLRAIHILTTVDSILVEDTRHSKKLLNHIGSTKPTIAYHDHNERDMSLQIIERMKKGEDIALISDAGTPLINDPGYQLVRLAHTEQIQVIPIPGASAAISALSVSGLATDKFLFLGFLPAKANERRAYYETYMDHTETLIFYESTHRIMDSLKDAVMIFGRERNACLARELTKHYENVYSMTLVEIQNKMQENPEKQKGEFVIMIEGVAQKGMNMEEAEANRILKYLLDDLPTKKAAAIAEKITGVKKNALYQMALMLKTNAE